MIQVDGKRMMSRRRFCLCCVAGVAAAGTSSWLTPRDAYAEARGVVTLLKDSAASAPIKAHKLRGGLTVLEGSGGNIAVLSGPDGKLLIDTGLGASRPQVEKALAAIDDRPVTHVINTHWHFDHTDGNMWLAARGAAIIGHANTKKYLSMVQRVEDWDYNFLPYPPNAVPGEVFSGDREIKLNGVSVLLTQYQPAHTDSDISVAFPAANIVHAGDTFWVGGYPFIDYSTGGSIGGMIAACGKTLATANDETIIIPGHGRPVGNKRELTEFRDMLVGVRDAVAKLKSQGRSRDEVVAAKPTAPFDARFGNFAVDPPFFTRLVYEGV